MDNELELKKLHREVKRLQRKLKEKRISLIINVILAIATIISLFK